MPVVVKSARRVVSSMLVLWFDMVALFGVAGKIAWAYLGAYLK